MSVFLAIVGDTTGAFDDAAIARALSAMRAAPGDRTAIWRGPRVALAVARQPWEMSASFSGDALVVTQGELAIVADASIYYREALRDALGRARITPAGDSASHLILAAYRAWGDDCAAHLEGDFAFAIWDGAAHRVVAARDFSGKRTLFHSTVNGALVLASTAGGALALPGASPALNLTVIAETAAGLWGGSAETCYKSVRALLGGSTLVQHEGTTLQLRQHWSLPLASTRGSPPFEEAARELRELLMRAVTERLDGGADSSVWLSGGWDSPAVFAAGANALES
ncbi:MAG TPA: hypothetical protein VN717_04295, partial [Gemmatimonadaceae bacterium]|nr:hypothetical protein [Gemmatimonadaceae bacterium]